MLSRMRHFWNTTFLDDTGKPKQGEEYQILYDMYDFDEIGIILRWRNGKLHDDGYLPAVEFQDTHIEHYRGGLLHNEAKTPEGKLQPAIITDCGSRYEYFIYGKQVR